MSKLRMAIAALSIFAVAGLTACDNKNDKQAVAKPAAEASPSKADDGGKSTVDQAKIASNNSLRANKALIALKSVSVDDGSCDQDVNEVIKSVRLGGDVYADKNKSVSAIDAITDKNSSNELLKRASNAIASKINQGTNPYCKVMAVSSVAKSFSDSIPGQNSALDSVAPTFTVEEYNQKAARIESVTTALQPIMVKNQGYINARLDTKVKKQAQDLALAKNDWAHNNLGEKLEAFKSQTSDVIDCAAQQPNCSNLQFIQMTLRDDAQAMYDAYETVTEHAITGFSISQLEGRAYEMKAMAKLLDNYLKPTPQDPKKTGAQ